MNLIEELGVEKARAIVDGAPEGTLIFLEIMPECDYHAYFAKSSEFTQETAMIWDRDGWVGVDDGAVINARLDHAPYIKIENFRTAIAEYECDHDWDDISSMGDAERQLICTYCSMKKSEPFGLNAQQFDGGD